MAGTKILQECQRVIDVFNRNDSDSTNGLSLEVAWHGRMLTHLIGDVLGSICSITHVL